VNDISALREVLFETLNGLKTGKIDVEKAKAINETAQVLVNTAKVEVDYLKTVDARNGTGFISPAAPTSMLTYKGKSS
jgi:predicted RNA methylase